MGQQNAKANGKRKPTNIPISQIKRLRNRVQHRQQLPKPRFQSQKPQTNPRHPKSDVRRRGNQENAPDQQINEAKQLQRLHHHLQPIQIRVLLQRHELLQALHHRNGAGHRHALHHSRASLRKQQNALRENEANLRGPDPVPVNPPQKQGLPLRHQIGQHLLHADHEELLPLRLRRLPSIREPRAERAVSRGEPDPGKHAAFPPA